MIYVVDYLIFIDKKDDKNIIYLIEIMDFFLLEWMRIVVELRYLGKIELLNEK